MASNLIHLNRDITQTSIQYIAHQCNCVSRGSKGLAKSIFEKYPYANFYSSRDKPSIPGTIHVSGDPLKNQRHVIGLLAQYYPGPPKSRGKDTLEKREFYLQESLEAIAKIPGIHSIAFPFNMGCNLAGGNWEHNLQIIHNWSLKYPLIKVYILNYS